MKKVIIIIALVIGAFALFTVGLALSDLPQEKTTVEQSSASTPGNDTQKAERFERAMAIVDTLSQNFHYTTDEFEGYSYYVHKNWLANGEADHTTPIVLVGERGQMVLRTVFIDRTWMFHQSAIFIVDGNKWATSIVASPSVNNTRETIERGRIKEIATYKSDGVYATYIGQSDGPVKVRYEGKGENQDFELSQKDHQAFKESYQLHEALQAIQANM